MHLVNIDQSSQPRKQDIYILTKSFACLYCTFIYTPPASAEPNSSSILMQLQIMIYKLYSTYISDTNDFLNIILRITCGHPLMPPSLASRELQKVGYVFFYLMENPPKEEKNIFYMNVDVVYREES